MQDTGVKPEHRRCLYLEQLAVGTMQQVATTLLDPDECVTAERAFRHLSSRVLLLAGA